MPDADGCRSSYGAGGRTASLSPVDRARACHCAMRTCAELELHHSRVGTPTRRLALGTCRAAADAPGALALLLGAVAAAFVRTVPPDDRAGLDCLMDDLDEGRHVTQPRVHYRLQEDVHGLDTSVHRLWRDGTHSSVEVDRHGPPLPQL